MRNIKKYSSIWAGSSVGSSRGLKILVSAVRTRPGPPEVNCEKVHLAMVTITLI